MRPEQVFFSSFLLFLFSIRLLCQIQSLLESNSISRVDVLKSISKGFANVNGFGSPTVRKRAFPSSFLKGISFATVYPPASQVQYTYIYLHIATHIRVVFTTFTNGRSKLLASSRSPISLQTRRGEPNIYPSMAYTHTDRLEPVIEHSIINLISFSLDLLRQIGFQHCLQSRHQHYHLL